MCLLNGNGILGMRKKEKNAKHNQQEMLKKQQENNIFLCAKKSKRHVPKVGPFVYIAQISK